MWVWVSQRSVDCQGVTKTLHGDIWWHKDSSLHKQMKLYMGIKCTRTYLWTLYLALSNQCGECSWHLEQQTGGNFNWGQDRPAGKQKRKTDFYLRHKLLWSVLHPSVFPSASHDLKLYMENKGFFLYLEDSTAARWLEDKEYNIHYTGIKQLKLHHQNHNISLDLSYGLIQILLPALESCFSFKNSNQDSNKTKIYSAKHMGNH